MPNHRMLAVAALIVLSVPALGAAAPYLPVVVSDPVQEQLVEGHTVFTVIEVNRTTEVDGATRFAAAVAILVREQAQEQRAIRFPGVLWFNDQYLVTPQSQNAANAEYRYPCGGAVMAVNRGDPDPRMLLARAYVDTASTDFESSPGNNYTVVNVTATTTGTPYANASSDTGYFQPSNTSTPGVLTPAQAPGAGPVPPTPLPQQYVPGQQFSASYKESYTIVDPNDHTWVVDFYVGYHRASVDTAGGFTGGHRVYEYPIWVVNVLGSTTFVPDDGSTNCAPFYDLANQVYNTVAPLTNQQNLQPTPIPYPTTPPSQAPSQTPGATYPDNLRMTDGRCDGRDGQVRNSTADRVNTAYPYVEDDPCAGYAQPQSRNGYCYGGQTATGGGCGTAAKPLRIYNALLYFKFEHLRVAGGIRNHSSSSTDTNGCQVGTEWACPEGLNPDDMEGNSHPFHPTPHSAHTDTASPCYPTTDGTNQPNGGTNHGGSSGAAYGAAVNGMYGPAACDLLHATRDIDVYFSPQGRPMAPLMRTNGGVSDTQGSDAPFHDYNAAYGTSEP